MRKLISFDIDTKVAAEILGDYHKIYSHIKIYFLNKDFSWQQGSTYISNKETSHLKILKIVKDLYIKYPYMKMCVRDMVVADIGKRYSLNYLTEYNGTPGKFSIENTKPTPNGPIPKEDFLEYALNNPNPRILNDDTNPKNSKTMNEKQF